MKSLSVGFIIRCPSGILLGHTTGSDHWDVPKGGIDIGETPMQGAMRELREETGLVYDEGAGTLTCSFTDEKHRVTHCRPLGRHEYTKRKDLELFELTVDSDIDVSKLKCLSMVDRPTYSFPELDRFALASRSLHEFLTPALFAWFKAHL